MTNAQDLTNPLGKVHRVNDDGTMPKDNPFVNTPNAVASIWSYGHRNPQGLAWDPVTGKLWESEHGPQGGDEINIIEKGHNYGWGVITWASSRASPSAPSPAWSSRSSTTRRRLPRAGSSSTRAPAIPLEEQPVCQRPCRAAAPAPRDRGRQGDLQEVLFNQFGRVHDVIIGPDGYLYVTLQLPGRGLADSTPGMVARLMPVQQ